MTHTMSSVMEHVDKPGDFDDDGREATEPTESSDVVPILPSSASPAAKNPFGQEKSYSVTDSVEVTSSMLSGKEEKSSSDDACAKCLLIDDGDSESAVAVTDAATSATSQSTMSSTHDGTVSLSSASKSEPKDDVVPVALTPFLDEEATTSPAPIQFSGTRPGSPPCTTTMPGTGNREQPMSPSLAQMRDSFREAENRRRASRSDIPVGAIRVDHLRSTSSRSMERSQSLDREDNDNGDAAASAVDVNWHFGQTVLRDVDNDDDHPTMAATTVPVVAYLAETETMSAAHTNNNPMDNERKNCSIRSQFCRRALIMIVVLALAIGAVLGGVCGSTSACRDSWSSQRSVFDTAKNRRQIASTEDLYQAIDEYYSSLSSESSNKTLAPIHTWDVSRLSNFSRAFDPSRRRRRQERLGDIASSPTIWNASASTNASRAAMSQNVAFAPDLSGWDMSSAATLHGMFAFSKFNGNISSWNTTSVLDMSDMFYNATQFDSDISQWDVSNVISMDGMFNYAIIFASNLSPWNVSSVRTMRKMFSDAARFSSSISSWNVSNLQDMSQMFRRASSMNQSLCEWATRLPATVVTQEAFVDSGCVDTADPVLPHGPFCAACLAWNAATPFETTAELYAAVDAYVAAASSSNPQSSAVALQYGYPIGTWDVSKLTDFSRVFDPNRAEVPFQQDRASPGVSTFNESLSGWDTSSATTMFGMFAFASNFNGNISTWNTSSVLDMGNMFTHASFDGDIGAWDVGRVESMNHMFFQNHKFNSSLSDWNVSSVSTVQDMFKGARSFSSDLSRWNVSKVENMQGTFYRAVKFSSDLSAWDVSRVTAMDYLFREAYAFTSDLSRWNVSRVRSMIDAFRSTHVFQSDLSKWDVSNVDAMEFMFCHSFLFHSDLSRWNVAKVRNMEEMFRFTAMVDSLSTWDVGNVGSMKLMFADAQEFNSDLSRWNVTAVKNMESMFQEAKAFSSSISGWDVSNVYTMKSMFSLATSFDDDISDWNVSSVTNTEGMFKSAIKFNSDLSDWDVRKLQNMAEMFMSAYTYNHSLCAWADRLPATVNTLDAFSISGCLDPSDPVLQGAPNTTVGPFCAPCGKLV